MENDHIIQISSEIGIQNEQTAAVAGLIKQGATIPFIARYRKEATGSLDEVIITQIRDRLRQLDELDQRKETVLKSLTQHGHLTEDLEREVKEATTISAVEDLYLPFRPKRRTRATIAREKGLEPLALALLAQEGKDPFKIAKAYVDIENKVDSIDAALSGARDILSEIINEDSRARAVLRRLFKEKGVLKSRVDSQHEDQGAKFKDYFDFEEPVATIPSHRILAMRRGEKEGILFLNIAPPEEKALRCLEALFVNGTGDDSAQIHLAVADSYKRLLSRSMETETRIALKERADQEAISVFARNLRPLLLAPPLGARNVMGIDPGFRTGCKLVCLDRQGKLLHHDIIFIEASRDKVREGGRKVVSLCRQFDIEAIAIGNGTAGRETEAFVRDLSLDKDILVMMVNESGASVYSASEVAREEFPNHDLTVRGAVSIGRRLMDPLAELVKIDPRSIGVGQYQHDVDPLSLKQSLDDVTISCVNSVGVDLNRASAQLLAYVSGIGPQLARSIVAHRDENGPFPTRKDLKAVPRLGPKAFEQSAGFLRIPSSDNPLDASAVHPESYPIVDTMARRLDCTVADLMNTPDLQRQIDPAEYVSDRIGLPTLRDILAELAKPGRDPRDTFDRFTFAEGINSINDVMPGMKVPGIVTNVTAFGAFVDIGVHQDGLVHISEMSDHYVKDPASIVRVQQSVLVRIKAVDRQRNRISLSMKTAETA